MVEKGIYKLENLFNTDNIENTLFPDVTKLIELVKTIEFQQLMFEAKLKIENVKLRLHRIINQNKALIETIEKNIALY